MRRDLGRRALDTDLRPEVDRQLVGRLARLWERIDGHDRADADVDLGEVVVSGLSGMGVDLDRR
jgi:hypothetical protein